jgi:hypothetical protein
MRNREELPSAPCQMGTLALDANATLYILAKWEIRLHASNIRIMNAPGLGESTLLLRILGRQQMASRSVRSQHLAARRDFKTLRNCFTCFAPRN